MAIVKPFQGIRPPKELVEKVQSRPYDVLNSEEAKAEAAGNEMSLYHIIKPEIDFDPIAEETDPRVYAKAAENFRKFQDKGWLKRDTKEQYYIYAQTMNGKTQYGLVVCAYVEDYLKGNIKKHELTRADKEEDRMKHVRVNNANIEPVFFAYPDDKVLDELVAKFDYTKMSKSPAVFDYTKLRWMNGEYLKAMDFDKFYEMALPYLKSVITADYDLKKIAAMVKTRIEIFPDIKDHVDFFEAVPEYDISMYTHKKMKTDAASSLKVLKDVLPILKECEDYSNDNLFAVLSEYASANEYKTGYVMWPVRTALSGKQMTPGGATELMEILGKEESLKRIGDAIEKLS